MGHLCDVPTNAENECHTWGLQGVPLLGEWGLVSGHPWLNKWEEAE